MKKTVALLLALTLMLAAFTVPALADTWTGETYTYDTTSGELHNIDLAVAQINGTVVYNGGYFSFNDIVGPRSQAAGYTVALNGRGAKVRGGGVSQVASAIYLAVRKISGVYFNSLSVYGSDYCRTYVSNGSLAVVTDYNNNRDFSFTNNAGKMTIYLYRTSGKLVCEVTTSGGGGGGGGSTVGSASIYLSGTSALKSNVQLAASSIGTFVLKSGHEFSFNDMVGPRTSAYGYKNAINGRGVQVMGGGVAQVASVMWLAVKKLSYVKIVERTTYGDRYNQSYVSSSYDAVVTDYANGRDFRFRNSSSSDLTISVYVSGGYLYCNVKK